MQREASSFNTYNYGDSKYWDARYLEDGGGAAFDWYQRYAALRPFIRKFLPTSSRILMAGCGNALATPWLRQISKSTGFKFWVLASLGCSDALHQVVSEDMVRDGYEEIVNVDISSVAIDMMKRKYAHVPQLKYMEMDVKDMSFFPKESFDSVIDKGTLDSLMCGINASISASQMIEEVSRILKPGGIYMLITYGDPSVRIPHIKQPGCNWKILLHILPRPGFHKDGAGSSRKSYLEPVPLTERGLLPPHFVLEDPDCHFIYVCKKMKVLADITAHEDL